MYLIIDGDQYSVSRRIKTIGVLRFMSVEPEPSKLHGIIQMFTNEGVPMSEDNVDDYARYEYTGTLLTLTNEPEPRPIPEIKPEPETTTLTPNDERDSMLIDLEYRLTLLELGINE